MTKYLILVLWITQYVNATYQSHNAYCSKDNGEEKNVFGSAEIFCTHLEIQKGDQFRLKNQPRTDDFLFAALIYVTGDLHETSLDLLPKVRFIRIRKSKITEFSLKSEIWHLDVTNSLFPKVTSERLKGCKRLSTLGFMSNPGLEFEAGAFRHLNRVENLAIVNQTIPQLQKSLLEGLDRLEYLVLNLNNLSVVDEDAFLHNLNLRVINLDDNPIEYFKANISLLTGMRILSLANTKLKVISVDMTVKRIQLSHLNLPTTYLLNTNSSVMLAMVPNLYSIGINSKDFECPTVKPHLKQLELEGFRLSKIDGSYYLKELVRPSIC